MNSHRTSGIRTSLFSLALMLITSGLTAVLHAADGSLSFDGNDDYVEVPNFQTLGVTNEVTVEFWALVNIKKDQSAFMLSPDNSTNRFLSHLNYSNGGTYWDFGNIEAGGRVAFPSPPTTVGSWTHYALVGSHTGSYMKIYVNGTEAATVGTFDDFETTPAYALHIGGSAGFFLDGKLDDFRVWNVARTQAEIRTDLGGPLTGSESGLRLYFKFDEGSGSTAVNSATATGAARNGTLHGVPVWSTPARTTYTVNTTFDENDTPSGPSLSLREALRDAAAASGPALITFAPLLSGQTITLSSEISSNDASGVTIDGSSLPAGVRISGNNTNRIFYLDSGSNVVLRSLTLADGKSSPSAGGAVFNSGTLTMMQCTLSGNRAYNVPMSGGGAIFNQGTLRLAHCTLSDNHTSNSHSGGGAIFNQGTLTLTHCTVSGNTDNSAFGGGGITNTNTLTLSHTIVSGNTRNGSESNISGTVTGTNNLTSGDPLLAPLGNYGGPTHTMPPLPGSPAIDAAPASTAIADQRSVAMPRDGDGIGAAIADIGAVEALSLLVQNSSNSGLGSLRQVVADAPYVPGFTITFAPALSGQTIILSSDIFINGPSTAIIDATSLPGGVTLSGGNVTRIFYMGSGSNLALIGLTLTGGNGTGFGSASGGAIFSNGGTLALTRCTLSGNSVSGAGGAILNFGTLTMTHCTLSSNRAKYGGAIANFGVGTSATLAHCTLALNASTGTSTNFDGGGAIDHFNNAALTLSDCILAGNTSATANGPDLWIEGSSGPVTLIGRNLISDLTSSGLVAGPTLLTADPLLAPLGNYGGPTQTMALRPGSPARGPIDPIASITNPGFEENTFGGTYIYTGNITGWTSNFPSSTGLSRAGSPFTNNGTIPEGTQVAFLQSLGPPITLSTTISNLVPGRPYIVTFRVNARSGYNTPSLSWSVTAGATTLFSAPPGLIQPVGGATSYPFIVGSFIASADTATLAITNSSNLSTDSTLLIDQVTVAVPFTNNDTDQRGFPIVGVPDIGAYEAGTAGNFATTLAETLPNTGPASGVTPAGDFDGDGQSNQAETTAGTILTDPSSYFRITSAVQSGETLLLTCPSVTGRNYTLYQSDTLSGNWIPTPGQSILPGNGGNLLFTIPAPSIGVPKRFHRVQVGP